MAGSWPRLIRDPIHGLIRFEDKPLDRLLLSLIECREFQRLRRIHQLGFGHLVFPGATHTRFAHSLGVMWNAKRFLDRIESVTDASLDEQHRTVIVVGALLHDVGHGPFSHAFEAVSSIRHERRTVEIVLSPDTQIHRVLRDHDQELPQRISSQFPEALGVPGAAPSEYEFPAHLAQIVASQLDADRFDYLVRDSHYCGTSYGEFDPGWLLDHLHVDRTRGRLYLSRKAHHAAEAYVFARYHMYQAVYFHKATRAAEVMCRLLLQRYVQLSREHSARVVLPGVPEPLERVLHGSGDLTDFLSVDDHAMSAFLRACSSTEDQTLRYLSVGLLDRRLYKCIDATDVSRTQPQNLGPFVSEIRDLINRRSTLPVEREYALTEDTPSDTGECYP